MANGPSVDMLSTLTFLSISQGEEEKKLLDADLLFNRHMFVRGVIQSLLMGKHSNGAAVATQQYTVTGSVGLRRGQSIGKYVLC